MWVVVCVGGWLVRLGGIRAPCRRQHYALGGVGCMSRGGVLRSSPSQPIGRPVDTGTPRNLTHLPIPPNHIDTRTRTCCRTLLLLLRAHQPAGAAALGGHDEGRRRRSRRQGQRQQPEQATAAAAPSRGAGHRSYLARVCVRVWVWIVVKRWVWCEGGGDRWVGAWKEERMQVKTRSSL